MIMFNSTTVVVSTQSPQPALIQPVMFLITFIIGTAGNILVILVEAENEGELRTICSSLTSPCLIFYFFFYTCLVSYTVLPEELPIPYFIVFY